MPRNIIDQPEGSGPAQTAWLAQRQRARQGIQAADTRPFYAVRLGFNRNADPVFLWSGVGSLVIRGETYMGVGSLGGVGPIGETSESRSVGIELFLSGIPSSILNISNYADFQGDAVDMFMGSATESNTIVGAPYHMFRGTIDQMRVSRNAETQTSTITAKVETSIIELERPRESRYTPEEQKSRFPGDLGFDYVASLQTKEITWG